MQTVALNPAQIEVLNVMSCLGRDEDLSERKKLLVTFLNERLQRELDVLWDNGTLDDKALETLRHDNVLKQISFPQVNVLKLNEFNDIMSRLR